MWGSLAFKLLFVFFLPHLVYIPEEVNLCLLLLLSDKLSLLQLRGRPWTLRKDREVLLRCRVVGSRRVLEYEWIVIARLNTTLLFLKVI